jgi:hypothetical protein
MTASGGCGAGLTVAIGWLSSARAAGISSNRSCTQLPAGMSFRA